MSFSAIAVSATYVLYAPGAHAGLHLVSVLCDAVHRRRLLVFMPAAGAMGSPGCGWWRQPDCSAFSTLAGRLLPPLRLGELIAGSYRPLPSAGIMVLCVHNRALTDSQVWC